MTGAERVWEELEQLGVDTVFGVPGGAILPLVDALSQHPLMPLIVTRHESAAIHAADGYARVSGKVGVALVTSGPGGTNALTGLMTAMTDSVPLVVLVGQVPLPLVGSDAFQEADLFTMALSVVKHSWKVEHAEDAGRIVEAAYQLASAGRSGPVMVELPKDVQMAEALGHSVRDSEPSKKEVAYEWTPTTKARLRAYLGRAQRPVFYVGGGVTASDTGDWVRGWAERWDAPVVTTLMGLGTIPSSHPLALGMLGMHGTYAANQAIQASDLVIALGVRFDDRVTGRVDHFAPDARVIHVEIDPGERNKIVTPDVTLAGDLRRVLPMLDHFIPRAEHPKWRSIVQRWQEEHPVRMPKVPPGQLSSPQVLSDLSEVLASEDVVVTDVGQHQMWSALMIGRDRPRRFVTSGGAGTMGYGLPAAIGARFGQRRGRVVLVSGDGSFQMNMAELATLAQYQLAVGIVVMNNGGHGMVRQWQDLFHGQRRHGVSLKNPDFVDLARVFGIPGFSVKTDDQWQEAITAVRNLSGPWLLEVLVDPDEMVFPMVPSGKSLSEVIEG